MLPITVIAVFIVLFVDNNLAYNSVADGPMGRWIANLNLMPAAATTMGGSKSTPRNEPAHPLRAAALQADARSDDPSPHRRAKRRNIAAPPRCVRSVPILPAYSRTLPLRLPRHLRRRQRERASRLPAPIHPQPIPCVARRPP